MVFGYTSNFVRCSYPYYSTFASTGYVRVATAIGEPTQLLQLQLEKAQVARQCFLASARDGTRQEDDPFSAMYIVEITSFGALLYCYFTR